MEKIKSNKQQFVAVEFELLKNLQPILEQDERGSTIYYITLQTFINRQEGHAKEGTAFPGIARMSKLTGFSRTKIWRINKVLEKHGLLTIVSGQDKGVSNTYTINELPKNLTPIKQPTQEENLSTLNDRPLITEETPLKNIPKLSFADVFTQGTEIFEKERESKVVEKIDKLLSKDITKFNTNDALRYYGAKYLLEFKANIWVNFTAKDRKQFKRLIDDYGAKDVIQLIDYAIANWVNLDYVGGYPAPAAIYGFRNTLLPESKLGQLEPSLRGQFRAVEKEDVYSW